MYLNITTAAQKRIQAKLGTGQRLLLDFDDGVGPFSPVGACSLNLGYRLIVVPETFDTTTDYRDTVDSDLGAIAIKPYSETYLADDMKLDVNEQRDVLTLSSNQGLLASRVDILVPDLAQK
jgi:uncharacterized protein YqkB